MQLETPPPTSLITKLNQLHSHIRELNLRCAEIRQHSHDQLSLNHTLKVYSVFPGWCLPAYQ